MVRLMEKAIAEIDKLPAEDQEALAAWIIEELASERRWSALLAESEDLLGQLADEALAEHRAGRSQKLDLNEL